VLEAINYNGEDWEAAKSSESSGLRSLQKAKVKRMADRARVLAAVFVIGSIIASLQAQTPRAPQDGSDVKVDYAATRREIRNFENVLNNVISSTFSASPFALVQKPKGVYLQGYGVELSFLINIHRAVISTPFGDYRQGGAEVTPELKKRRIEDLKEKLVKVLQESGDSLHQLRRDELVTIVAFFEDRNFPDEPNENKTLILSVHKKDLDELGRRDDRWNEFKQRMRIVEY
jgi:hypothetical protein